jgi:Amt family ammonium transporter
VVVVAAFVFCSSLVVWLVLKHTIGIRVSLKEEIEGLDIGEHGNRGYPEFAMHKTSYSVYARDVGATTDVNAPKGGR